MQTIDVPLAGYDTLDVPEDERDDVLRRELAVSLKGDGILSLGRLVNWLICHTEDLTTSSVTAKSNTIRSRNSQKISSLPATELVVADTSPQLALFDRLDLSKHHSRSPVYCLAGPVPLESHPHFAPFRGPFRPPHPSGDTHCRHRQAEP